MADVYETKEELIAQAQGILHKTLRDVIPESDIRETESVIRKHGFNRKGLLGEYIEWYLFGKKPDARSEADFNVAGIELKTNPLKKHETKTYVSKERLVFSMINYDKVVNEEWENSSFLKKNKYLLIMFYLWMKDASILDYEFKFVHFLDMLKDISSEDILQIRKDWEFIVAKIKKGEAHLLSEGDTYYLGACTKAANSQVLRDQPGGLRIPAKPRAFSFKQQYLNYLIQSKLLGRDVSTDSIFKKVRRVETIEDAVMNIFSPYMGKTDKEIMSMLRWHTETKPKAFKRLLVNRIFDTKSGKVAELEKANVTLKVITFESTGTLKESLSFPAFDYKKLVNQAWFDEENETMADFHLLLEMKRFLFVVFRKIKGNDDIVLEKIKFWNFPMSDLPEAERVFNETKQCINKGRYGDLPKITESDVAHVRPHAANNMDTIETPQGTQEVKKSFWLNAKYIQKALEK